MQQYSVDRIHEIADKVYRGLAFFTRDLNLPEALAEKYTPGTIIREESAVAVTACLQGMLTTHSYVILSNHMEKLPGVTENQGGNLYRAPAGSRFKVLGVQSVHGKTGIFLLHLPQDADWKVYGHLEFQMDEEIYLQAVEQFIRKICQTPALELADPRWLQCCSHPLGMDKNGEFYPVDQQPQKKADLEEEPSEPVSLRDRFRGCLLGGAVGDALGYPVEFRQESGIAAHYGPRGIQLLEQAGRPAVVSDDTQMTLFAVNAIIYAKEKKIDLRSALWLAYREWLGTQGNTSRMENPGSPQMELYRVPELHARRAPGTTCLTAISTSPNGGTMEHPINSSKGCGTVMRAAPFGLMAAGCQDLRTGRLQAFRAAAVDAALTHGHRLAWESSGMLAEMIFHILKADPSQEFLKEVIGSASSGEPELDRLLSAAVQYAGDDRIPSLDAVHALGEGWVAEEALAIAVYSALRYPRDAASAIRTAVNHGGDSDSTGAICGSIMGAWLGAEAIHKAFDLENLEMRDLIVKMADVLYDAVFAEPPQEQPDPEPQEPDPTLKPLRKVGMLYTELTKKALAICFDAHRDQRDQSGLPYVFHPFHVAEQLETEEEICTALLHDVLEDSFYTVEDLRRAGFPESVLEAVSLMTHDEREPYLDYVRRIRKNPIARRVKLADLTHNCDLDRLNAVTAKDRERIEKYRQAMKILEAKQEKKQKLTCCEQYALSEDGNITLNVIMDEDRNPCCYYVVGNGELLISLTPEQAEKIRRQVAPDRSIQEALAIYGALNHWNSYLS